MTPVLVHAASHPDHAAPLVGSAVSCAIGFDLHTALGVAGQMVGILSGVASIGWVLYQAHKSSKS